MGLVFGCPLAAWQRCTPCTQLLLCTVSVYGSGSARRARQPERLPARQFRSLNDTGLLPKLEKASGR